SSDLQNWDAPIHPHSLGYDGFVTKLDSSGHLMWNTFVGAEGDDYCAAAVADGIGNLYLGGSRNVHGGASEGYDFFLTKLDSNGTPIWNTILGGPEEDFFSSFTMDNTGSIYLAGRTCSTPGFCSIGVTQGFIGKWI